MPQPEIQVISSLVVQRQNGDVLLIRYDADDERWWLPGDDLVPYEHPDDAARKFLARDLPDLECDEPEMLFVESFRPEAGTSSSTTAFWRMGTQAVSTKRRGSRSVTSLGRSTGRGRGR